MRTPIPVLTVNSIVTIVCAMLLGACTPISRAIPPEPTETQLTATAPPSPTALPSATASPSPSPTSAPTVTPTPMAPLIAVDAGHGGRDLGARHCDAQGQMDYHESTVTLELARLVRDVLVQRGFRVLMVRDGDYLLNDFEEDTNGDGVVDTADDLQARIDLVNAEGADLLLSIHLNAFFFASGADASDMGGIITYYCAERSFSDDNHRFAQCVHEALLTTFREELGHAIDDRGVEVDTALGGHLYLLGPETERITRASAMPGVLSEPLFLTHRREGELARDPVALQTLATAYADAVEAYFAGAPEDTRSMP